MFKENREFWLYLVGIVIMFFLLFFGLRTYIGGDGNIFGSGSTGDTNTNDGDNELQFNEVPPNNLDTTKDYYAVFKTNKGDFEIDLFEKNAPNTVNNFIFLTTKEYYNGISFHRLIPGVLIQGGSRNTLNDDPEDDKFGGPGYIFEDEINWDSLDFSDSLRSDLIKAGYISLVKIPSRDIEKYRIAMANTGSPNTNGSQFFIVLGNREDSRVSALRGRYTVFAEVVSNTELIDSFNDASIINADTQSPRPEDEIIIEEVKIFIRE